MCVCVCVFVCVCVCVCVCVKLRTVKIKYIKSFVNGGARGVMVSVAGIGHGDTSSNPGLIVFHTALIPLGKV